MLKYFATTTACLLGISCCFAQQTDSSTAPKQEKLSNEFMIKFAPLSIIESDGGLSFSAEYLIPKQHIGYQLELQPIFFSIDEEGGIDRPKDVLQSEQVHGIKLRPEVRFYIKSLNPGQGSRHRDSRQDKLNVETLNRLQPQIYLAAAFMYKQTQQPRVNEFNIYNSGTRQSYQQQAKYIDVKRIAQFEVKLGVVRSLGNNHWLVDVYFGIGLRNKRLSYRNIPPGAISEPDRGNLLIGSYGTYSGNLPAFPSGIRVVYRL